MKVIIAGSRSINDMDALLMAITVYGVDITEVVSGCAQGADKLGEKWATQHGIPIKKFPADWKTHGKSAGARRNIEMAQYADALIALWDGTSKGTRHMIGVMTKMNKPAHICVQKNTIH